MIENEQQRTHFSPTLTVEPRKKAAFLEPTPK